MIDHDEFVEWARSQFGDIRVHGDEVQLPDIWWEAEHGDKDGKLHCWVNTSKNCFHAFKSGTTGNLIKIVMEVEGCDWDEAYDLLGGENSIRSLRARLHQLYSNQPQVEDFTNLEPVQLPLSATLITTLPENKFERRRAEDYLKGRKLSTTGLMVCLEGEYIGRIIIPYRDSHGKLIYFNSRDLTGKSPLRYKGPPKELYGVGKADVIWMSGWPKEGTRIYLAEGEFDAMSVNQAGLPAAACGGKAVSNVQAEFLRPYRVTIAFDNDKAGQEGLQVGLNLLAIGFKDVRYVRPPAGCKDWNELLIKYGEAVLNGYIKASERPLTQDTITRIGFNL